MSVKTKYYYGQPGQTGIIDAELAHTKIYRVTRSGVDYYFTGNEDPASLQFVYGMADGVIGFDTSNPFNGPLDPTAPIQLSDLEKISVKFRA